MICSNHALQRYAERISQKESPQEIAQYIDRYAEKIQNDIEKMIAYGECVYEGESMKQKGRRTQIYVKDNWVVIYDADFDTIVTLYQVDLGVSETCNKMYISEVLEKIRQCKDKYLESVSITETEKQSYMQAIEDNTAQIAEYKRRIRELEQRNEGLQTLCNTIMAQTRTYMDAWQKATMLLTSKQKF